MLLSEGMSEAEGSIRKLQYTGKSSYSVNLPKSWVESLGLKPQDSLVVEEEGSSLRITPLKQSAPLAHQVDFIVSGESTGTIVRRVISAYLAGCETIRILPSSGRLNASFKDELKSKISARMIGFEVIEDSLKELTFQALVTRPQVDIFTLVRRMYFISYNMLQEAVSSIIQKDKEEASSVIKVDDDMDRFHFYGVRTLNQAVDNPSLLKDTGLNYRSEAVMMKTIVKSIERIADHAVAIASLVFSDASISADEADFIKNETAQVSKMYEDSVTSFFKIDGNKAEEALVEHEEAKKRRSQYSRDSKSSFGLVLEHVRRVSDYSADICETVIDLSIARAMRRAKEF